MMNKVPHGKAQRKFSLADEGAGRGSTGMCASCVPKGEDSRGATPLTRFGPLPKGEGVVAVTPSPASALLAHGSADAAEHRDVRELPPQGRGTSRAGAKLSAKPLRSPP